MYSASFSIVVVQPVGQRIVEGFLTPSPSTTTLHKAATRQSDWAYMLLYPLDTQTQPVLIDSSALHVCVQAEWGCSHHHFLRTAGLNEVWQAPGSRGSPLLA